MSEQRLSNRWRALPVVIALSAALIELSCLGGIFFGDTASFLAHTRHAGLEVPFQTRNPAYPLLLDALCLLLPASARMGVLVLLQQLCVAAIPWLVLRCGEQLGRPRVGFVAGMLAALHAPISLSAQCAMSDSLFAFLLALTGFWFVRALRSGSASHGWLAGALAAGAMAQRSSGVALVAAAVVALLCAGPRRHLRPLLHFLGGFLAMLLLVLAHNNFEHGRFTLVDGDGIHLFCRVAAVEKRLADTPEAHRIERLARDNGIDVFAISQAGWELHRLLRAKEGLSQRQADELLGRVARQALWLDPWRSVKLTIASMVSAAARRNPVNYVLDGCLSLPSFADHRRRTAEAWSASPDRFAVAQALLPPYPPRADEGDSRVRFVRAWARASRQWTGAWVLIGLLVAGVAGLVRREAATLFFAGLPIAQLAASAIGDIPFPGHFDAVVPATWLALLLALPIAAPLAFPPRLTKS